MKTKGNTVILSFPKYLCKKNEINQHRKRVSEMKFCQIAIIVLYGMALGAHLFKHGEPKEGKYNFWSALLSFAIYMILLTKGGFFS